MNGFLSDEERQRVFLKVYDDLCAFAEKKVRDKDTAASIVVEKLAEFFETDLPAENDDVIRRRLFTAVRNACIDHLRKLLRQQQGMAGMPTESIDLFDESFSVDHFEILTWVLDRIRVTIEKLPRKRRIVMEETIYYKKSVREVALKYSMRKSTVYQYKKKDLRLLTEKFDQWGEAAGKAFREFLRKH